MIEIDLRRDLPKVRQAFTDQLLQRQADPLGIPCYSGPCAIGVMLTREQREQLDDNNSGCYLISSLVHKDYVAAPKAQIDDLRRLQRCHDSDLRYDLTKFDELLTELEIKYAT